MCIENDFNTHGVLLLNSSPQGTEPGAVHVKVRAGGQWLFTGMLCFKIGAEGGETADPKLLECIP